MLSFFKKHFNYSVKQRQGINVLLFLIICGLCLPWIIGRYSSGKSWNFDAFENQVDRFIAGQKKQDVRIVSNNFQLVKFDPNTANYQALLNLGFSEKQANTILNYRKSGGKFHIKSDLKKVYGIGDTDYSRVKSYISLPDMLSTKNKKEIHIDTVLIGGSEVELNLPAKTIQLNLNEIDSLALLSINGIGPVFARRIINYRNYLGGFYKLNQLNEVYNFTPELYDKVSPYLTVDSSQTIKVNINSADFKEINRHPYFNYRQTKAIFKYRKLMNEFKSLNELLENNLLDTLTFTKIKPYLTVK